MWISRKKLGDLLQAQYERDTYKAKLEREQEDRQHLLEELRDALGFIQNQSLLGAKFVKGDFEVIERNGTRQLRISTDAINFKLNTKEEA
ncbi:hypothetical protein HWB51_gp100 [Mycobacterium phage Cuke]|uniref:Uncharacterized protein n=1 Tax=Mycobacterium phage Cuke TaxID=2079417 RepID=A0A2L1IX28_9CAUD|nr:hypothetical protein HWB51_gp100 [Mycobacterium phage Cuke]AVD99712.1 hypothetical protein SEA_CUKE_96 [Mycobacterium phage Cuke]